MEKGKRLGGKRGEGNQDTNILKRERVKRGNEKKGPRGRKRKRKIERGGKGNRKGGK